MLVIVDTNLVTLTNRIIITQLCKINVEVFN